MSFKKYMFELVELTLASATIAAPMVIMMHYSFKRLNQMPVKVNRD